MSEMVPFKKPRGPRFIKAYTRLIRDKRISREARFLYVILKAYANAEGSCWPSAALLAEDMGTGRRQVFRWLKELESFRIITRAPRMEGGKQTSNLYMLDDEHFAKHLARKNALRRGDSKDTQEGCLSGHTKKSHISRAVIAFPKLG